MSLTIWHNPRCSKSRQTLALLEGRGLKPAVRLYLDDAPSEAEIRAAVKALGLASARGLMRTGEEEYKALGLKEVTSEAALVAAMAKHPKLIERPVVFARGEAALAIL